VGATVTVVIPVRNGARTLERCLRSLRAQTHRDLEIVVVDNASTDRTPDIARQLADRVVASPPAPGIYRNIGLHEAVGDYVLYVDADMTLTPELIAECVRRTSAEGLGAMVIPEHSSGGGYWGRVRAHEHNLYVGSSEVESPRFVAVEWLERVGGFREDLTGFEDMALSNELRAAGCRIGRSHLVIEHDEGSPTLGSIFAKKRLWGAHLNAYRQSYPDAFRRQALRPTALRGVARTAVRHPILATSVAVLKLVDVAGYVSGVLAARVRP
jgi:glycosyltransferase involved in cell wall biosynthesis